MSSERRFALIGHTHSTYLTDAPSDGSEYVRKNGAWAVATGGAVATDVIWDAKGDLAVGTGANTSSKLTVGTDGYVLTADSTTPTGLKWAAGGGSAAWGSITGTLSSQTDLQTALDGKFDLTGDTVTGNSTICGTSFVASNSYVYITGWLRFDNSEGLYTDTGDVFYNRGGTGWNIRGAGTTTTDNYLKFEDGGGGSRGYILWDNATVELGSYDTSVAVRLGHSGTYGALEVSGTKGSYAGLRIVGGTEPIIFMHHNVTDYGGIYAETSSKWKLLWDTNEKLYTNGSQYEIPVCTWSTFSSPTSAVYSRGTSAPSGGSDGDVYYQYV